MFEEGLNEWTAYAELEKSIRDYCDVIALLLKGTGFCFILENSHRLKPSEEGHEPIEYAYMKKECKHHGELASTSSRRKTK